jgi:5-methyltetrahydropteroyltriglutamate--homocysteine methyltransferase
MAIRSTPPFRAEHIGSLHRPKALREARVRLLGGLSAKGRPGDHGNEELRRIEDDFIREAVRLQEDAGIRTITDGEFRRQTWLGEFLGCMSGMELSIRFDKNASSGFKSDERKGKSTTEDVENVVFEFLVREKIRWQRSIHLEPFRFLKSITRSGTPKVTMPAPQNFYWFGGRASIDRNVYPDIGEFWADLADVYRREIAVLVEAGCSHIQFDDVVPAMFCDPSLVAKFKARGEDPQQVLAANVACLNEALRGRPESLRVSMHICRGNRHGHFVAEGGYDPVADYLFNNLNIDNYYLEYDSPRAGSFEPLRLMPKDRTVVLGLVTTKRAELEPRDELRRRIDEAARYVPLERLALSPQCGFSGDMMSDVMSVEQQAAKLRHVVETARAVWGEA